MITVDALMHGIWSKQLTEHRKPLSELVASAAILTFGSPITHIYQHYFPRDYGAFSETGLKDLAADKRKMVEHLSSGRSRRNDNQRPDARFP